MRDDFSLGDLTDRITELEEETAKGMEGGKDAANKKTGQEDFVPKALPPFPELRYLNLAYNQVGERDKFIISVSACLVLSCLKALPRAALLEPGVQPGWWTGQVHRQCFCLACFV